MVDRHGSSHDDTSATRVATRGHSLDDAGVPLLSSIVVNGVFTAGPLGRMISERHTAVGSTGGTMGFVQIIKMVTSDFDGLEAAHEKWLAATEGRRTVTRELVCQNRDKPGEYWIIVEFPSHEDALRNNDLPATAEIALEMGTLANEAMEFINLDVIRQD